jgi:hypothetical protein
MANKDEIANAIKVIKDVAGDPTMGAVKELIDLLNASVAPATEAKDSSDSAKEVRVLAVKETR